MKKLVVLTLDGDLREGFRVSVAIGSDGLLPDVELSDSESRLPPIPTLFDIYQEWCKSYRSLDGYRIKPKPGQIYNIRFQSLKQECYDKAEIIKHNFITWLQADSFRRIKEQCLTYLTPSDEVRFIIRTSEIKLRKLPWHLWELFEYYPDAEVALSSLSSQRIKKSYRPHVRILIILGNSEGINVVEDAKLLKQYCQKAEIVVLDEPSPLELNEHLWDEKGWDILFFSGHSITESAQGRIFINRTDSLTMHDLREGLKTAVKGGLQLAFFNSCDGLGIAAELEVLNIPQIIVVREPVPDRVAHQFLKYFFQEFTQGKSLYQSVNIARKKLQGLEKEYPCASWLPVIIQKLLETPPTWQSLGAIANCPYRGLAAFRPEDAPFFYGREIVTQQLVAAVKKKPFIAVIGASGSGKSSVVFAGLIPQLKQDRTRNWLIVPFRPGNNPFESLAIAITPLLPQTDRGYQQRLAELTQEVELKQSDRALQNFIETIIQTDPKSHLAIVVDQFEELYTLYDNIEERKIFLDNLLNAVKNAPAFTLIVTLRADFYGDVLSYRPLADALQDAHFSLGAMNAPELQAAIEQPAKILNVQLEEGLTQRLVDAVLESPNHLPLLEFTLTQLWQKQRQGWMTHQAYAEIGGVETALALHAEEIYAQLSVTDKEKVQQIFIQLVQPIETSTDIRRLATREQIGEDNWDLVTRLADARLVVTNRNEVTVVETVEIIHEALIKNWRRFGQWMRIDGEFRRWQEQLRIIMRQWENSAKDPEALLRGKPLIDAEEWLWQRSNQISCAEENFINLSIGLREQEQQAKKTARKRTLLGLTVALVGALILASVALFQWRQVEYERQQAQVNELKSLTLSAKVLIKSSQDIEALISLLKSSKSLNKLNTPDRKTKFRLLTSILEVVNDVRQYNSLQGHEGSVTSVSYSPNGQLLASASQDKTIKIWRRDGKLLQTLSGHKDGIYRVTFSHDGQFIIAASFDNTITLWQYNSATGLFENRPFPKDTESVRAIALSSDNQILAKGTQNGKVKFQTVSGKELKTFQAHNQKIWSLSFSRDRKILATASGDKTIKLWNLEGKLLKTLQGHNDEVLSVDFSPSGKVIASAGRDKTVKLWDSSGKLLHTYEGHTNEVLDVRFSSDGKLIASAGADNKVKVWSVEQKKELYTFEGHGGKASEVTFSPDGKTLASASDDRIVKLWRMEGILPTFQGNSVSISPDGQTIAIANKQGIVTRLRRDGSLLESFKAHEGEIVKILFSPDGKIITTIGRDNQIKLWNLEGTLLKNWQGHENTNNSVIPLDPIKDISFSPDGKTLVTIGEIDKKVKVWNLEGTLLQSWKTNNTSLTSLNMSPDGKTLAIAGDRTLELWNLQGKLLSTLPEHQDNISSVSFSPDGKIIATGSNYKTVKLWQSNTGKLLKTLPHSNKVYSITFSPDSQLLVSASANKIYLWSLGGKRIYSFRAHQNPISQVYFSPDGKMLASRDIKDNVTLWNLDIKDLQQRTCDWLRDYLTTNPNLSDSDRHLCDGIK